MWLDIESARVGSIHQRFANILIGLFLLRIKFNLSNDLFLNFDISSCWRRVCAANRISVGVRQLRTTFCVEHEARVSNSPANTLIRLNGNFMEKGKKCPFVNVPILFSRDPAPSPATWPAFFFSFSSFVQDCWIDKWHVYLWLWPVIVSTISVKWSKLNNARPASEGTQSATKVSFWILYENLINYNEHNE